VRQRHHHLGTSFREATRLSPRSSRNIPANITLLPLPAKCPELNPVENVWQFMRDNWLPNRIFKSYDDILDHCCFAWNRSPISRGASCLSDCGRGRMGSD